MAHESFEDQATADYLNEHFVPVKVDREERPDVDAIYMQATVAMTGHGGWPMTCVLDHEGTPFFAGTYFPDKPRHGQPAFTQVLQAISEAWTGRRDEVSTSAAKIKEFLQRDAAMTAVPVTEDDLAFATSKLGTEFDPVNAGFGGAPKFPPSMVLEFLRRHHLRTGSAVAEQMLRDTCTAMAAGGLYDQLGGGFARYSVDAGWVVPHFEKMLYDNAQLLGLYARTGDRRVALETADFMVRELRTPEGGFASALDADTDGVEGAFYVWTPAQLVEVLGEEDGRWAAALLTVTGAGTFEEGRSTLQLLTPPDDQTRWGSVRARLLEARSRRTYPARDDKVVAAWNGLAISALVDAAHAFDRPDLLEAALDAGRLLRDLHIIDGRLRRVSRDGVVGSPAAVLEDVALVASAFLDLGMATGDSGWYAAAAVLIDQVDLFAAPDGGFYDTASDAEQLVARPRDPSDNASPSGLSAIVHTLITWSALTGSGRHRDLAEAALASVQPLVRQSPRFAGWSMAAAEAALAGPVAVVVVGEPGPDRDRLAADARRVTTEPGTVVLVAAPGSDALPILRDRPLLDGRPTAYVCRDLVCELPVTDLR